MVYVVVVVVAPAYFFFLFLLLFLLLFTVPVSYFTAAAAFAVPSSFAFVIATVAAAAASFAFIATAYAIATVVAVAACYCSSFIQAADANFATFHFAAASVVSSSFAFPVAIKDTSTSLKHSIALSKLINFSSSLMNENNLNNFTNTRKLWYMKRT